MNSIQGSMGGVADPKDTPMMSGMEHPSVTLGAPPLVNPKVLMRFCQAIQLYADGAGFNDDAAERIRQLRSLLNNLTNLAQLCRMTVLGVPEAFARLLDEMTCMAVDFPAAPLSAPLKGSVHEDEPDDRVQLASVFDLLTGAAFVSKDDPAQRNRLIIGMVRAIEDAICYPLAYSKEADAYLSSGSSSLVRAQAEVVIANATQRLIESDYRCNPPIPAGTQARLELMARKWMVANPVTTMFGALTGPQLDHIVHAIEPDDVKAGDHVTLVLRSDCADSPEVKGSDDGPPGSVFALFCPTQLAKVVSQGEGRVEVEVPAYSRSGPVVLVRRPVLVDVEYLLSRYACEYPAEWSNSLFPLIPMWAWAYPTAFGPPVAEVTQVPIQASVGAYLSTGPLSAAGQVEVNTPVYIHYQVDPPGSDQSVPLRVSASLGFTSQSAPGMVVYTPTQTGDDAVVLSWDALTEVVQVHVVRGSS